MTSLVLTTRHATATVEVLDAELTPIETVVLSPANSRVEVNLPPGRYQVRARRSDGVSARVRKDLPSGGADLALDGLWDRPDAKLTGGRAASAYALQSAPPGPRTRPEALEAGLEAKSPKPVFVRVIWEPVGSVIPEPLREPPGTLDRPSGEWRAAIMQNLSAPKAAEESELLVWRFNPWFNSYAEVTGNFHLVLSHTRSMEEPSDSTVRFIALPPIEETLAILFRPNLTNELRLSVDVYTFNPRLDMLLEMLSAPVPNSPRQIWDQLTGGKPPQMERDVLDYFAYGLMQQKFRSPVLAAAAGHYLLRFNMLQSVRDWPRNLADYFPWLPDGPIIEGWRRLLSPSETSNPPWPSWRRDRPPPSTKRNPEPNANRPDDPNVDAALRFIDAASRGAPVFYTGLRRLDDGLRWCWRHIEDERLRTELLRALERSSRWLAGAQPAGALTGLTGLTRTSELMHEGEEKSAVLTIGEPMRFGTVA